MNMANIAQLLQQPRPVMHALAAPVMTQAPQAVAPAIDPRFPQGYTLDGSSTGQVQGGESGSGQLGINSTNNGNVDFSSLLQNAGYAGPDYSAMGNAQSGGESGGGGQVNDSGAQLQAWLAQNGYSIGNKYGNYDQGDPYQYTNIFDSKGNKVGGQDQKTLQQNDDQAFQMALLGGAAFATAGAAGAFGGSGAFGLGGAADGAGGIAGAEGAYPSSLGLDSAAGGEVGGGADAAETLGGSGGGAADEQAAAQASDAGSLGSTPQGGSIASSSTPNSLYSDYAPTSGAGAGAPGQALSQDPASAGYSVGGTSDPYTSGTGAGGFGSSLQDALTTQNAAGDINGISGLGKGLVGLGAGALSGGGLSGLFGGGNTGLLNSVNYQNAATAQGQSARTNQTNSQGSLTYNQNGVDAQGNPTYSQTSALNAPYQANLNSALGNQNTALGNLQNYNSGLAKAYAGAPSLYGNAGSQADLVKQAQDAAYNSQTSYLDPQYAQMQKQLQAQLANQGVSYGSDAYNAAQTQLGSQQNQAYGTARDSAISQGDAYANTLFNQNLAANQQYNANINNQGTNYQNLSGNALSGVVQNPTFAATPPQTNYLGAAALQGQSNVNQYNAQTGNANNTTNGLTNLATAALGNQNVWNAIGNGVSGLTGFFGGGGLT